MRSGKLYPEHFMAIQGDVYAYTQIVWVNGRQTIIYMTLDAAKRPYRPDTWLGQFPWVELEREVEALQGRKLTWFRCSTQETLRGSDSK